MQYYLKFSKLDDFSYAITCINNVSKIINIIDEKIWDNKKIGNTLFIKIKIEKSDITTRSLNNINFDLKNVLIHIFY